MAQRQTSRQRRYHWQGADVLTEIEDSLSGRTRFTHDLFGALAATEYADGTQELRQPDAVGNLFRTVGRTDRRYSPGGQLLEANGTRYRYDVDGNLLRKHTAAGQTWHYAWNAAGQLASVTLPSGYAVSFTYDALGRRLSKRYRGRVTHWVWDGDQPLHEWTELEVGPGSGAAQDLTTWLFEDATFAPPGQAAGRRGAKRGLRPPGHAPGPLRRPGRRQLGSRARQLRGRARGPRQAPGLPLPLPGPVRGRRNGPLLHRYRYYDPEVGSYISQDPIGLAGGGALHAYVADPLTQLDVFGLSEGSDILGRKLLNAGRTHGINPFVKNDFRAHHVIPHKVWVDNQKFFDDVGLGKKLGRNGMNPKDSAANGVFMPKDNPTGTTHKFDEYHSGGHANTSAAMRGRVEDVRDRFNSGTITKNQARKEVSALQKAERNRLSSRRGAACTQMP